MPSPGCWGSFLCFRKVSLLRHWAGLPPEYGLYSAIVPTMVAALAGSSRHVVTGPTNANSLALFAMIAPLAIPGSPGYIQLALAVTVLVGIMQLATGLLRIGSLANFISPTALLGFTSGAALLIAIHALKESLGIEASSGHGTMQVLQSVFSHLGEAKISAVMVTLTTILSAVWFKRHRSHWPYMLISLFLGRPRRLARQSLRLGWQRRGYWACCPRPSRTFTSPTFRWNNCPIW